MKWTVRLSAGNAKMAAVPSVSAICACVFVALAPSLSYCDPVVNTTSGMVRGQHLSFYSSDTTNDYYVYKGIPYAEPPVGPLRFSAPMAKAPWPGVFNASRFGPSCPQDLSGVATYYPSYVVRIPEEAQVISEDCLTLNVYSPFNISQGSTAVMVWIHGGAFETGQGSGYDASALTVLGGVVVVTVNYRLNVFGFLSTSDESAPGNYGLLDQQLALQWVQENIAVFGGDPSRVTLFGQSAGGASALLHLYANNSRPLFHRVAAHSGVFVPAYAINRNEVAREIASEIGRAAGIPQSVDSKELVDRLRNLSMEALLSAGQHVAEQRSRQIFFPVLDNNVLSLAISELDLQHEVILLITSGDGSTGLEVIDIILPYDFDPEVGVTEDEWALWLKSFVRTKVEEIATSYQYIDWTIPDKNFAREKAVIEMFLDWNFLRPIPRVLDAIPNSPSIHVSIFDHRSMANTRFSRLDLVTHGEDLSYVFGLPFGSSGLASIFTEAERQLSDRVIQYWSNFAKSGDPNVNPDLDATDENSSLTYWPEYGDSETYLLIQLNKSTVGQGYRKDKVKFWTDYLPKLSSAALESCPAQVVPTTDKPGCKEIFFGEGLGLKLSAQEAETLIEAFMFVIIALLAVLILFLGAVLGYKFRYKESKAALRKNGVAQQTNGKIQKSATFEVNEGFTSDSEDTKM